MKTYIHLKRIYILILGALFLVTTFYFSAHLLAHKVFAAGTYTISGRIVDNGNTPGANSSINVTATQIGGNGSGSATTDANGNYTISVPNAGQYAVTVDCYTVAHRLPAYPNYYCEQGSSSVTVGPNCSLNPPSAPAQCSP